MSTEEQLERDDKAVDLLLNELWEARKLHPAGINSQLEGWAVIHEETVELFDAIRAKPGSMTHPNRSDDTAAEMRISDPVEQKAEHSRRVRQEAIHVGAMALRFLIDLELIGDDVGD